jgi:hypothetical protein
MSSGEARDFLDSVHGRHAADMDFPRGDASAQKALGRSVRKFRRSYNPADFE